MACSCIKYTDLVDRPSLNKRGHDTKKILAGLQIVAKHSSEEHIVYKCTFCGQFWQRSLDWMRGNKPYLFKVPTTTETDWLNKPFVQPDELFNRVARIHQYLERASFVETAEKCRHENCSNQAIELSVFCAFHHMENIGIKSDVTDEYEWFDPYAKQNFEFEIGQLRGLPNYKALKS